MGVGGLEVVTTKCLVYNKVTCSIMWHAHQSDTKMIIKNRDKKVKLWSCEFKTISWYYNEQLNLNRTNCTWIKLTWHRLGCYLTLVLFFLYPHRHYLALVLNCIYMW